MSQCAVNSLRACAVPGVKRPLQASHMPNTRLSASFGDCGKNPNKGTQRESYGEKAPLNYEGNQKRCQHNYPYLTKPPISTGRTCKNEGGRQSSVTERGSEQNRKQLSCGTTFIQSFKPPPDCHTNKKTGVNLQKRSSNPHSSASRTQFGGQTLKVLQPGSPTVIDVCSAKNQNYKMSSQSDSDSSVGDSTECSDKVCNIGIGDGTYKANAPKPKPPAVPIKRSKLNMIHPECQELLNNTEKTKQIGKVSSHYHETKDQIENKQRKDLLQEMFSASYCNGLRGPAKRNSGQISSNRIGSAQCNNGKGVHVCNSVRRQMQMAQSNIDSKSIERQPSCNRHLSPYRTERQCQPQRKVPNCLQQTYMKHSPLDWKNPPQSNRVTENQNTCSPPPATIKRSNEIARSCSANRVQQDSYLERVTSNKHLASEQKPEIVNQYLKITNLDTVIIQPGMPTVIKVCQGQSPQEAELVELEQSCLELGNSKSDCSNEFSSNKCGHDQAPNVDNQTSKCQHSAATKLLKTSSNGNDANKEKCAEQKNISDSKTQQNQVQCKENPTPQPQSCEKGCKDECVLPQSLTKDTVEGKDSCTCLPEVKPIQPEAKPVQPEAKPVQPEAKPVQPEAKQPQCGPAPVGRSCPGPGPQQQGKQMHTVVMPQQPPRTSQWQYGSQLSMPHLCTSQFPQCALWPQQQQCVQHSLQQQYGQWSPQQKRISQQSSSHQCCGPPPPQQVSQCSPAPQQAQATIQRNPIPWPAQKLADSQPLQQSPVNDCAQNAYQLYNMPAQPQQPSSWYPTSKSPELDNQFCENQWESQLMTVEYQQQPQYETQYQNSMMYQYQDQQWPQNVCAQNSPTAQPYTNAQYQMAPADQDPETMNQCQSQMQQYDPCLLESEAQNNCDSYDDNQVYSSEDQGYQMYQSTCADDYNTQNVPDQRQSDCFNNNASANVNEFYNNPQASSYHNCVCG